MLEAVSKLRYPVILCIGGIVLVLLSFYSVSGNAKEPVIVSSSAPNAVLLVVGILSLALSCLTFLIEKDAIDWLAWSGLSSTGTGFLTSFRSSQIHMHFGALQKVYDFSDRSAAVVLPVNEFFDEACFADAKTATGAFVQEHFPGQMPQLHHMICAKLAANWTTNVEKETGVWAKSYGAGTCLYLEGPLSSPHRMIFAAVASKRAGEGLRSELRYIYDAMHKIERIVADQRLSSIYIPLLGAGKGGVPAHVALVALLTAAFEAICKPAGYHLREFHVVIYCRAKGQEQLSRRRAKRVFKRVQSIYKEATS